MPRAEHTYSFTAYSSTRYLGDARTFIVKHTNAHSVPNKIAHDISLAVDEALTNVIEHAYADNSSLKTIKLELAINDEKVTITITDSGKPFEELLENDFYLYNKSIDLDAYIKEKKSGGLGLHIIGKLMSDVSYKRVKGINTLKLTKILNQ